MIAALPPIVYRITRAAYARTTGEALSGIGGLHDSGRWHSRGSRIVYTSETSSLSTLERLVHADEGLADRRSDRITIHLALPPVSFDRIDVADLAAHDSGWRAEGAPFCRALGDAWLAARQTCALIVPSATVPHEANILLNPAHPEFIRILAANDPLVIRALDPDPRFAPLILGARAQRSAA